MENTEQAVPTEKETETVEPVTNTEPTVAEKPTVEKADPVTVEPTEPEKEVEVKTDATELEATVKETEDKLTKAVEQLKKEQKTVEGLKTQVKELETVVNTLFEAKLSEVDEKYHALVPDGDAVSKLAWLTKAEQTGLFTKEEQAVETDEHIEIGKPLTVTNPNDKAQSKLTAQQKIANYFGSLYANKK